MGGALEEKLCEIIDQSDCNRAKRLLSKLRTLSTPEIVQTLCHSLSNPRGVGRGSDVELVSRVISLSHLHVSRDDIMTLLDIVAQGAVDGRGLRVAYRMLKSYSIPYNMRDLLCQKLLKHFTPEYPLAYFDFGVARTGSLRLPQLHWGAFRGYTFNVWLCMEERDDLETDASSPTVPCNGSVCVFSFRGSNDAGIEVFLSRFVEDGWRLLTVRSAEVKRERDDGSGGEVVWHNVHTRVRMGSGRWHMLSITHSQPYVSRAKACVYLDGALCGEHDLVYPSSCDTMVHCSLGGGWSGELAAAALYHDAAGPALVRLLFAAGPNQPPLGSPPPLPAPTQEQLGGLNPLALPLSCGAAGGAAGAGTEARLAFFYTASSAGAGLCYEESSRGRSSKQGRRVVLAGLQPWQCHIRHAKLNGDVIGRARQGLGEVIFRSGGPLALLALLRELPPPPPPASVSQ